MVRNAWSKEVIPEMQLLCAGVVRPETGDHDSFLRDSGTKVVLGLVDAQRSPMGERTHTQGCSGWRYQQEGRV